MIDRTLLGLTAALFVLAGCGEKSEQGNASAPAASATGAVVAPAGTNWATTVAKTPEGGFRMGNPDAPVKLVEYASLTCSHCAEFAKEGFSALQSQYVGTGKVSFELRNYVRDAIDVTAALLTRCRGPEPYFKLTEQILADQAMLFERSQKLTPADMTRINALPVAQQFGPTAQVIGLDQYFKVRGLPAAQANACLSDQKAIDELTTMNQVAGDRYKLAGTPTFLLNGKVVEGAADWATLKPVLDKAIAG